MIALISKQELEASIDVKEHINPLESDLVYTRRVKEKVS